MDALINISEDWQTAEALMVAYFPRLWTGVDIKGNHYQLKRHNEIVVWDIDWAIYKNNDKVIGAIDTESKPGWTNGPYPYWSVARLCWKYNKGLHNNPIESMKVQYFRKFPDVTFWMPIRADYRKAGIITGRKIIESPIHIRPQPKDFARPIEIFEFDNNELVFCEVLDHAIENYVINQLNIAGAFDNE